MGLMNPSKPHQHRQVRIYFMERAELVLARMNELDDNCAICDDHQWWYDNGYSEEERVAICALICPPHAPDSN